MASLIFYKIENYWKIMDKTLTISAILDSQTKLSIFSNESLQNARKHIQIKFKIYEEHFSNLIQSSTNTSITTVNTICQYFAEL